MMKPLAAFENEKEVDWTLLTPKNESVFSLMAKKGPVEALEIVAALHPGCIDPQTPDGAKSAKLLAGRGAEILSRVEAVALAHSTIFSTACSRETAGRPTRPRL